MKRDEEGKWSEEGCQMCDREFTGSRHEMGRTFGKG